MKASIAAGNPEAERVLVDYTYVTGKDSRGRATYQGVRYTRVGSISEAEAIKRGYERDEYMDRRERVSKARLAGVTGVNQEHAT